MIMQKRIGAAVLAAAAVAMTFTGTAQAETNPHCRDSVQIGATKYIKKGTETVASLKQYKGCNKNWAYTYVWDAFHNRDGSYSSSAAMVVNGDRDFGSNVNGRNKQNVWSEGTNTITKCTRAYGEVWDGSGVYWGQTDERC